MIRAIDDYETEEKQWSEQGIPDPEEAPDTDSDDTPDEDDDQSRHRGAQYKSTRRPPACSRPGEPKPLPVALVVETNIPQGLDRLPWSREELLAVSVQLSAVTRTGWS